MLRGEQLWLSPRWLVVVLVLFSGQYATCASYLVVSVAQDMRVQETLADVGGVQTSVASLEEQVKEFVKREEYDCNVALLATKGDVEELQAKASDLQSLLEAQREICENLDASKARMEAVVTLNADLEALQLSLQQLQTGKVDVEIVEAVTSDLAAAQDTISTLAAQKTADALQGEIQGLQALCKELLESSNASITELKDAAGALQSNLMEQAKQLADQEASSSAIRAELALKASHDDAEKLQADLQQLQQQTETFATVQQVETMSQDMKQVQQGLNHAVSRMEDDARTASDGKSAASAEVAFVLEAQQKQQAASEESIASIKESLQQLQAAADGNKIESDQAVSAHSMGRGCMHALYTSPLHSRSLFFIESLWKSACCIIGLVPCIVRILRHWLTAQDLLPQKIWTRKCAGGDHSGYC